LHMYTMLLYVVADSSGFGLTNLTNFCIPWQKWECPFLRLGSHGKFCYSLLVGLSWLSPIKAAQNGD